MKRKELEEQSKEREIARKQQASNEAQVNFQDHVHVTPPDLPYPLFQDYMNRKTQLHREQQMRRKRKLQAIKV